MPTRRITYRLYPNKTEEAKLHWARKLHCTLYNAALATRKTQYQKFGHSVDYFEQQNSLPGFKKVWVEYQELAGHALQATLKRVDFAYLQISQVQTLSPIPRLDIPRQTKLGSHNQQRGEWTLGVAGFGHLYTDAG